MHAVYRFALMILERQKQVYCCCVWSCVCPDARELACSSSPREYFWMDVIDRVIEMNM